MAPGLEARAASQSSLPGVEDDQATVPLADEGEKAAAASFPSPPPPPPRRAFFATSSSEHQRGADADAVAANGVPAGFILSGVKEGTGLQARLEAEASSAGGAPATTRNSGVVNGGGGGRGGGGTDGRDDNEEEASAAERLSRQVESLLARVEFLEKRRAFEGVGWGAAAGGVSRGGSGAIVNSRKGSEVGFLSEEGPGSDGSGGKGGTLLVTPPPRIGGRHGSGGLQHALGVSTTPFTGLDVLFRTPKVGAWERGWGGGGGAGVRGESCFCWLWLFVGGFVCGVVVVCFVACVCVFNFVFAVGLGGLRAACSACA